MKKIILLLTITVLASCEQIVCDYSSGDMVVVSKTSNNGSIRYTYEYSVTDGHYGYNLRSDEEYLVGDTLKIITK